MSIKMRKVAIDVETGYIRGVMRENGITLEILSEMCGITPASLSRIIRNCQRPRIPTWFRITAALGLDFETGKPIDKPKYLKSEPEHVFQMAKVISY